MINEEKKLQYWRHFTEETHKGFRPKNITDVRLKQIRENVLGDDFLWQTVISPYQAIDKTPRELEAISPSNYQQARMIFWAEIREKIKYQLAQLTEKPGMLEN
jgi:hypothetical protein